ncbi:hypothetical protein AAL_05040 [Moelleriella libera RCEF 2490]|uniref:Uncharacterized protein n=1 Tax=Moelleriella libera RCEF 2490 TaxID=1081109 RepID=A0A168B821_9HYPO|nr:hypothetical protein AAL_05040 [Moelleriella libera RCEF 2490]
MVSQPDHPSSSSASTTTAFNLRDSSVSSSRRSAAHQPHYSPHHHQHHHHQHQHQHQHYSASVVSRPSSSRTRRHHRSHNVAPQNEFPVFSHSGDVEIVIRVPAGAADVVENRYLLHRHTLTRCSGFFEVGTSSEWSKARPLLAGGHELARIGEEASAVSAPDASSGAATPKRRWRYDLDLGTGHGDIPMLVQRDDDPADAPRSQALSSIFGSIAGGTPTIKSSLSSKRGGPPTTNRVSFSRSVANLAIMSRPSQADEDLLRDYDNLFRIFYNYSPVLDGVNVADAYVQCKSLLALADQYDALAVVGPRVDHHLLQFQSRLWKQIAKYPISYLRLGYLARSKVIFQEALIHVVGQWPIGERSLRATLPGNVLDIIEDKVDELDEVVSRVEGRLFRLSLTTPKGDRVSPGSNFLDWLVVSLFRQWLADNTSPQPSAAPGITASSSRGAAANGDRHRHQQYPSASILPSSGRAYRTLGSVTPDTFLAHDECKKFLKLTPDLYSRDNLRRFEKRMDELKGMARQAVRPLLGSGLELDMAGSSRTSDGITYLTCTAVGNRDLPWPVED